MAAPYATRADLLAALSQDSQAKLTTDTTRRFVVGSGDGLETTFTTPFVEVTSIKGFVDGTQVTTPAPTLSRGTGTDGRDEIVFSAAPASGTAVSVTVDAGAINAYVLDAVLTSVSGTISKHLSGVDPAIVSEHAESLRAMAVLFAQKRLRGRRNLDVVDPIEAECRENERWLLAVAKGDIVLHLGAADPEIEAEGLSGSEPPVFGPPNDPTGDW